jgi:hypothetical protein
VVDFPCGFPALLDRVPCFFVRAFRAFPFFAFAVPFPADRPVFRNFRPPRAFA